MRVFEEDQRRVGTRQALDLTNQRLQRTLFFARRAEIRERMARQSRQGQEIGKQGDVPLIRLRAGH